MRFFARCPTQVFLNCQMTNVTHLPHNIMPSFMKRRCVFPCFSKIIKVVIMLWTPKFLNSYWRSRWFYKITIFVYWGLILEKNKTPDARIFLFYKSTLRVELRVKLVNWCRIYVYDYDIVKFLSRKKLWNFFCFVNRKNSYILNFFRFLWLHSMICG